MYNELKYNYLLIIKVGKSYIYFDEFPRYSGRISDFFINVYENIRCDHGYAYSLGEKKVFTKVNEKSWAMMKTCFPDAKQIKNSQNPLYAENVHMFKYIEIKVSEILIPNKIMKLTFHHNFS